jgi:hypothetical protein
VISQKECVRIFKKHLPKGTKVNIVSRESFVQQALNHFFIQRQIELGIYDIANIHNDFVSCAVSYSEFNQMDFCYDMLCLQADGLDDTLVRAFVTYVALHEAHHLRAHHLPRTIHEQAQAEEECIAEVDRSFPDLAEKAHEFEAKSPVFQRVMQRVQALA